jgi:glycolate oxidase FAD binding subunit
MSAVIDKDRAGSSIKPSQQSDVADAVRAAYEASRAVYPLGGRTALDYGSAPAQSGIELDLTGLAKVVDYTPRDMTIVVEAGIRMSDLGDLLAAETQQLPIDVPRAAEATLGGVVATNWAGPRRYGYGTIRDYVIGINAVDGRGVAFKGGGRVVKNVAGYDFCKLLCGSMGTLAVVTQLALKLKPRAESWATVAAACPDLETTDILLNRLTNLPCPPVAIDYLGGVGWKLPEAVRPSKSEIREDTSHLVVHVEGSEAETDYLAEQIQCELRHGGGLKVARLDYADASELWTQQVEFADQGVTTYSTDNSPLVIKIAVPSSAVTKVIAAIVAHDAFCTVQAHTGNGIVIARFHEFKPSDVSKILVGKLRPLAVQHGGSLVVLSSALEGLTPHLIWGGRSQATMLLERIKQQFDPHNVLNPGRFIY